MNSHDGSPPTPSASEAVISRVQAPDPTPHVSGRVRPIPGPPKEQLEALKQQHGGVYRVSAEVDGEMQAFLVRVATPGEWQRFMSMVGDDKKRAQALDVLLRQVALWPSVEQREAMLTRYPGLVESFGNRLTEICGLVGSAEAEKL